MAMADPNHDHSVVAMMALGYGDQNHKNLPSTYSLHTKHKKCYNIKHKRQQYYKL